MSKDLTGQKFGRWTVSSIAPQKYNRGSVWHCICECGTERDVLGQNLLNGISTSCGCWKKENLKMTKRTHGDSIHGKTKRLYRIWQGMKARCQYPSQQGYKNYGGRGIKVCAEWLDYSTFKEWAFANGYNDSLSIDRIDPDGNYYPKNCRWTTKVNQARNMTTNRIIEANGKRHCLSEWAEITGLSVKCISGRIFRGWDAIKALTTPINTEVV
jgi:hypothetical protein